MTVEKIVTYDEIPDKQEIFLSGLSFSHAPLPEQIEEARRDDSRLPKEFAFFALGKEGELLGRVGVVLTEVETKEGRLRIGGMWGVRTSPWRTKTGVARTLVKHVHEYLSSKDVYLSSLGATKNSVAYQFYYEMGYRQVDKEIRCTAARWAEKKREAFVQESPYSANDGKQIQEILKHSNEGLFGHTVREQDFISKRYFLGGYDVKNVSVYRNKDRLLGYAAFKSKNPPVMIGEIRAIGEAGYQTILTAVENSYAGLPIQISNGFSMREKTWLVDAGYTIQPGDYGGRMVYGLEKRSIQEIKDLLGVEEGLFRQPTLFDFF